MMRVIGTPSGSWSSASRWSTPMPSDTIILRFLKVRSRPGLGFQASAISISSVLPSPSAMVRKSSGPSASVNTFRQATPSVSRLM